MTQQIRTRQVKPQKTDTQKSTGLLQRSRGQIASVENDRRPDFPDSALQSPRESRFQQDFSSIPARTASSFSIQPKLTVGQPGDRYEQEADRVADQVMQSHSVQRVPAIGRLQPEPDNNLRRQPAAEEEKKKVAKEMGHKADQKKNQAEKEKITADEKAVKADKDKNDQEKKKKDDDKVQTEAQPGQVPTVTPALENHLNTEQGSGQPLPISTRAFMESRFHHDFSNVRVHTDPQATQALNARAFTRKNEIFFNPVQYQPELPTGQRLLAHELTHVVQQGAAPLKLQQDHNSR
jgi:Domain of unknown function (DUF4157)